ncbi:hypothetical protein BY996DRAFT_8391853 [Phakopsora pachyrhizi]|nr:hypothetical protein BY996DRAFT_8391853 [Phakopsora pachyrhizi]
MISTPLSLTPVEGNNTGAHLATLLFDSLKVYNATEKITAITAENASSNQTMAIALQQMTECHFRSSKSIIGCFAHVINLAAKAALKKIGNYQINEDLFDSDKFEETAFPSRMSLTNLVTPPNGASVERRGLERRKASTSTRDMTLFAIAIIALLQFLFSSSSSFDNVEPLTHHGIDSPFKASHIPPDIVRYFAESSNPEGSSGKVIGNYADVKELQYENPRGGIADDYSSRSSISNSDYDKKFSAKLYIFRDYPGSSRWKTISESFIEYFINEIHSFSGKHKHGAKDIGGDDIIQMFEALNRQKIYVNHLKTLCKSILSDEETFKIFAIKTINIVINKWGYISVFQTSDIQPHLEERLQDDLLYKDGALNMLRIHIKEEFSKLKSPVKEGFRIPYELNMDYDGSELFESFTRSVFVFHTVNYLRRYFEGASLNPFLAESVTAFDGLFDVFQQALKVQMEIINPEYVKDFQLKNEDSMTLDIKCLRLLKHRSTPAQVPDSKLILHDVSLDIKSSSIDATNDWLSEIHSDMRTFRYRYKVLNDNWPDDCHAYVACKSEYFKDQYFRDYIKHIKEQQQHVEENYKILEAKKAMFYGAPQQN